ncbi:hypothetical protein TcCL_NonESM12150 [Trypanosoma cruzi]|nr:hypothetical protein TcCL_NonESM12150 [Trypanosoma cruzi]
MPSQSPSTIILERTAAMAGFLRCARGAWEPWMLRHWDSLPATARVFCVCRRCDGHFRQFAHPFTARPLIYLAHRIPQARDIVADWPLWYGDAYTRNSSFLNISLRLCKFHAPQQIQRGVVLAWRVRYPPSLFPRQRACLHLLVEPWKHASTRRRFWITWWLTLWKYFSVLPAAPRSVHTDAVLRPLRRIQERSL